MPVVATVDKKVDQDGKCHVPLLEEETFSLQSFGKLQPKVFHSTLDVAFLGACTKPAFQRGNKSVHNAPHHHFERCGGARNFGIKTVVGIPIASPNVGRIVATLYSRHDRNKDQELVGRLSEEFTRVSVDIKHEKNF